MNNSVYNGVFSVLSAIIPILTFFGGIWWERRQERSRREHDAAQERNRRVRELAGKAADLYVDLARRRADAGPHALSTLALDQLGSDSVIREAIRDMFVRSGEDPWQGNARHVADVNLVDFFRYARDHRIDMLNTANVEVVARSVRAEKNTSRTSSQQH